MLTPDDLAAIRARHYFVTGEEPYCTEDAQPWPCDAALLLAEVDRLTSSLVTAISYQAGWDAAAKAGADIITITIYEALERERSRILAAVEALPPAFPTPGFIVEPLDRTLRREDVLAAIREEA